MPKPKRSDRTKPTPATSTQVLLDGYVLLEEFQKELRRTKEANQGAKTCTAPLPREHYDDRVQDWLRQVKNFLDSIDPTTLLSKGFFQTPIPVRYGGGNKDVVPLGDYCHRLPFLLEALNNLLDKPSAGQTAVADLPILSDNASLVYDLLLGLPEHQGITAPGIVYRLCVDHRINLDESTFRKYIVPALEPYGLEHAKKIGYRIKPSSRTKTK